MATRRKSPLQARPFAVNAAVLLSLLLFAGPAQAVKSDAVPCPKSEPATLKVSVHELVTALVSSDISIIDEHSELDEISPALTLLAPQAEAAIREAFQEVPSVSSIVKSVTPVVDSDSNNDADAKDRNENTLDSGMNTRLPGVSDDDLSRYKKQMFRRDI